jgi:hypothetical protein
MARNDWEAVLGAGAMSAEAEGENLERIVDELLQRLRRGEEIDWPGVYRRHLRHAEELKRLRPTMERLVKALLENGESGLEKRH